ncbi:hypothetical protein ACRZ5O_22670 [Pseudomonas protegens]|uniref:hypothetical protein n=1 Tax=Pseudomonas protegens TaxID=380021 RepID=UPI003FD7DB02
MGLFTRMFNAWALRSQGRDMQAFVDQLKCMDSKEIGFLLVLATHQRNMFQDDGVRLMDPLVDYPMNPAIALRLGGIIREYQRTKQPSDAAGTMVWLHTIRVGGQHGLRPIAREMWRQLSRGFPHVEEAAFEIMRLTLKVPRTTGYDQFPAGLTPDPM